MVVYWKVSVLFYSWKCFWFKSSDVYLHISLYCTLPYLPFTFPLVSSCLKASAELYNWSMVTNCFHLLYLFSVVVVQTHGPCTFARQILKLRPLSKIIEFGCIAEYVPGLLWSLLDIVIFVVSIVYEIMSCRKVWSTGQWQLFIHMVYRGGELIPVIIFNSVHDKYYWQPNDQIDCHW